MRVELNEEGYLTVYAQSGLEAYALRRWSDGVPWGNLPVGLKLMVDARSDRERGGYAEPGVKCAEQE